MNLTKQPIVVSLIVPIYGVEKYIAHFADSVLGQSYPYMQYVFVNDGTKDASMEVLDEVIATRYGHRKEQIVIVNKENGGLPAARQTGLQYATGDYVYHVDPDDWLSPDAIAKIVEKIEETGSDIVFFNYVKEYPHRSSVKRERAYTTAEKCRYIRDMYAHKAYGTLCNKCVRRGIYTDNTFCVPLHGYAEDCCMSVQLVAYAQSIAYLDENLYHYRKGNPQAMTRQGVKKRKREYMENFLHLYEAYRELPKDETPLACIFDDILLQAGWHSLIYGSDLYAQHPYLAREVRRARLRGGANVWIGGQLLVKLMALFK